MKLKEKILVKAIELFNEKGISSTSPNQIAAALGISTGNLTYHFKTKAALVGAVYQKMHEESKEFVAFAGYLPLSQFRVILGDFRDFMENHPFFFQDVFFILHNYPEVSKLYEESNLLRIRKGRELFQHYVETGRMIPEGEDINYDYLIHNVWMVGAFWNLQRKIFTTSPVFDKSMDIVEMTWHMILPYLTEQGKEEYRQINLYLASQ